MRRLYFDLLRSRLAAGDLAFPFRALRTLWAVRKGEARPLLGTLITTYRCDLACEFCDLPQRGDRKGELDTEELKGILDAFRDLGVLGVGITGGEPLLRKDTLEVARHGADLGMLMHLNTNGTFVQRDTAHAIQDAGIASVNISLDGPDAATHDRIRQRDGSFARVMRAVAHLSAVPRRRFRIALTCALGETNVEDAELLLDRARDIGVDRVGFIPIHDFPANKVAESNGRTEDVLARLLARTGRDPLLDNSRAYLQLFGAAYRGEANPVPCAAPRTSLVVDCYGSVFPCVPLNAARQEVARGDPREVWRSKTYEAARASLQGCRACFWNCHTELNLALRKLGSNG
ncbi:MAG: radical SAM protein [Planctomycetota bacterium]